MNAFENMKNFLGKETAAEKTRRHELELRAQLESVMPRSFRVAKLGKLFPGVIGVARDKTTPGCITAIILSNGVEDYAVYPELSIEEVIASFKNKDGIAEVNAIYVSSAARAVEVLLQ